MTILPPGFFSVFKRSYRLFIGVTLAVFVFAGTYTVYGILFAIDNANRALEKQVEPQLEIVYFNIDKLEAIKERLR